MICFRKQIFLQIFLLNRRCNGHKRGLLLQLQKLKERREVRDAFTATVMLMLMMMEIRSGPLSCKANFLLLQATESPPPPFFFTTYANERSLAAPMFIHTNGLNLQTQLKLPRRNFPFLLSPLQVKSLMASVRQ